MAPAVQAALPLFHPGSRLVNSIEHTSRVDVGYTTSIGTHLEDFSNVSYGSTGGVSLKSPNFRSAPFSLAFVKTARTASTPRRLAPVRSASWKIVRRKSIASKRAWGRAIPS